MLHKETASTTLFEILKQLSSVPELNSFRLVGGTAIALLLGHRKSIDIDFFSTDKVDMRIVRKVINEKFPDTEVFLTDQNLRTEIKGVRVELYDDWIVPFKQAPIVIDGVRLANLNDLAAFKISAIIGRREKKDYIDLYFLFKEIGDGKVLAGAAKVLGDFKLYDPLLSNKSILFALGEVEIAEKSNTPMPDMITPFLWNEIKDSMNQAGKQFLQTQIGHKDPRKE